MSVLWVGVYFGTRDFMSGSAFAGVECVVICIVFCCSNKSWNVCVVAWSVCWSRSACGGLECVLGLECILWFRVCIVERVFCFDDVCLGGNV